MCYDNFILPKGCDRESTSGVYSNDIGVDINFLNAITTKDQTGLQLWDDKVRFAGKSTALMINQALAHKFKAKTIIDGRRVGFLQSGTKAAGENGLQIYICDSSSYLDIYVPDIEITLSQNDTIDIQVLDAYSLEVLDTFPNISCSAGVPKVVTIDKTYSALRKNAGVIITHDASVPTVTTTVKESGCFSCTSNWICGNNVAKVQGVVKDGTWKAAGHTGGISIVYSVSCNYEAYICSIRNRLVLPILYKAGAEIMDFAKNVSPNDRVNTSVTINKDSVKERKEELEFKFRESLDAIIGNITLPNDERCFVCNQKSRHAIILP